MGLYGMTLPEQYGGGGRDLLDAILCIEQLARVSPLCAAGRVREQRRAGARHRALRHRGAEGTLAAEGVPGRDGDLDRHERARGRQRAHRSAHQGREGRRRLQDQRRQGLVHGRRAQPRLPRVLPDERAARAEGNRRHPRREGHARVQLRPAGTLPRHARLSEQLAVLRGLRRPGREPGHQARRLRPCSWTASTSSAAATPRWRSASPPARSSSPRSMRWSARPSAGRSASAASSRR